MEETRNRFVPLLIAILGVVAGYIISNPSKLGLCQNPYTFANSTGCLDASILAVGSPLLIFGLLSLIPTVLIALLPVFVMKSWLKFAYWWLPLSLVIIALLPVNDSGWISFGFIRENGAWQMGILFAVISIFIILYSWLSKKSN